MRAVAVVDGEHYPDVVRDALAELPYEFVGVLLAGGTEKLRGEPDYGVPILDDPGDAEIVVDLSDEPVLDLERRLALASRVLAAGIPYVGADFRFDPPPFHPFDRPSLAVIGTGKRVGKTAVTGHIARLPARRRGDGGSAVRLERPRRGAARRLARAGLRHLRRERRRDSADRDLRAG